MDAKEISDLFIDTRHEVYTRFANSTARAPTCESIAILVAAEIQARATEGAANRICLALEEWSR